MTNLYEIDSNLRMLPIKVDKMDYSSVYDVLYSVPNSVIPITANSLLGALSLADFQIKELDQFDLQEKTILHNRIKIITGGKI